MMCHRLPTDSALLIHSVLIFLVLAPLAASAQIPAIHAQVTAVHHETTGDHIRVVVQVDRPVRFVEGTAVDPYRIFFDLQDTRPADALAAKIIVRDDVLRRIRVAQYQPGVTRVVLDTARPTPYSASLLNNPPRLVVDIPRGAVLSQTRLAAPVPRPSQPAVRSTAPPPASPTPRPTAAATSSAAPAPNEAKVLPLVVTSPALRSEAQKQEVSAVVVPSGSKPDLHFTSTVPGDVKAALQAAQHGDRDAQFQMGDRYMTGRGVARDPAAAAAWYRAAAQQGHAVAASNLGVLYANGWGVKQNDAEAVSWFRKAADAGDAGGRNNLGSMYIAGRGVPQSDSMGAKLVLLAAQQGAPEAQYALGTLYANGRAVPRDDAQAVKWLKAAAAHGYAPAQHALGKIYEAGAGVARDFAEAYSWFALAAASGDKKSQAAMNSLAPRMSAQQLAEGQQRALAMAKPRP